MRYSHLKYRFHLTAKTIRFWFGVACIVISSIGLCQVPSADSFSIHLADPTIFGYQNSFFLYGTVEGRADSGFLVYTSRDLTNWQLYKQYSGYALRKGDAFGTSRFWAPQVFQYRNKFYMVYTADENIAIASSDHPAGPFKQDIIQPLASPTRQIDPFIFIDDDRKIYLYHVRLENGNRIFVSELDEDFKSIKPGTLKECISAEHGWENTANGKWTVAEGPSVFRLNNIYYLFYSANDFRNPDYAVGYATSNHPTGPWTKYRGNPILSKHITGINGPGHGDFVIHKAQRMYIFHTHNSNTRVGPRRTAIINMGFHQNDMGVDSLTLEKSSFHFLKR